MSDVTLLPILNEATLARLVQEQATAAQVEKRGFAPVVYPNPKRIDEIADGREVLAVIYTNEDGEKRPEISVPPYAAAINPAFVGNPADNVISNNPNVQKEFDKVYTGEVLTFEAAQQAAAAISGAKVQGDEAIIASTIAAGKVTVKIKDGDTISEVQLEPEDFITGWRFANPDQPRHVAVLAADGLVFKSVWKRIQAGPVGGLVVANGDDGYFDEAGAHSSTSMLVDTKTGKPLPTLITEGSVSTIDAKTLATAAFTAGELAAMKPEEKEKLISLIGELPEEKKAGVAAWLTSIGVQDFLPANGQAPTTVADNVPTEEKKPAQKKSGKIGTFFVGALVVLVGVASFGHLAPKRFGNAPADDAARTAPVVPPVAPAAEAEATPGAQVVCATVRQVNYGPGVNGLENGVVSMTLTLTGGITHTQEFEDGPTRGDLRAVDTPSGLGWIAEAITEEVASRPANMSTAARVEGRTFCPLGVQ